MRKLITVISIFLFLYSCASSTVEKVKPSTSNIKKISPLDKKISTWKKTSFNEEYFMEYFAAHKIDDIEGIWSYSGLTTSQHVTTGVSQNLRQTGAYKIAIIKDESTINQYNGYILETSIENSKWKPGQLKCVFYASSYSGIFEVDWYMGNFDKQKVSATQKEKGFIELSGYDPEFISPYMIHQTGEMLKFFPNSSSDKKKEYNSTGSGFLISEDGYIVTNYHVVEDSDSLRVNFPLLSINKSASILIKDKNNDIAILKIEHFNFNDLFSSEVIPFSLGNINNVNLGQEVFTLGFPLGDIMGLTPRYSEGSVSSLYGIDDNPSHLQISNPLQPGNSGGPLFNNNGELVGIVVSGLDAKLFSDYLGIVPQNVNFAIKINYLKNLISMIQDDSEIMNNKNKISSLSKEEQIKQIQNYIVQVESIKK